MNLSPFRPHNPIRNPLMNPLANPLDPYNGGKFLARFNPDFAMGFDTDLGSRRGTVVETEATYVNPVIRAFRSDGVVKSFPQAGLKAALEAWVAPSYSATAWAYDLTANGNDAVQATVANQSVIAAAGVVNVDALGNFGLDSDDGSGMNAGTGAICNLSTGVTVIAVIQPMASISTSSHVIWSLTDGLQANNNRILISRGTNSNSTNLYLTKKDGTQNGAGGQKVYDAASAPIILSASFSSAGVKVYVNGAEVLDSVFANDIDGGYLGIGKYYSSGVSALGRITDYMGMMVFDKTMTAGELARVHSALAKTYGITLAS